MAQALWYISSGFSAIISSTFQAYQMLNGVAYSFPIIASSKIWTFEIMMVIVAFLYVATDACNEVNVSTFVIEYIHIQW